MVPRTVSSFLCRFCRIIALLPIELVEQRAVYADHVRLLHPPRPHILEDTAHPMGTEPLEHVLDEFDILPLAQEDLRKLLVGDGINRLLGVARTVDDLDVLHHASFCIRYDSFDVRRRDKGQHLDWLTRLRVLCRQNVCAALSRAEYQIMRREIEASRKFRPAVVICTGKSGAGDIGSGQIRALQQGRTPEVPRTQICTGQYCAAQICIPPAGPA